MKKTELKKLSKEFAEFLATSGRTDIESVMSEFWAAKFGVNNRESESELLVFWKKH